MISSYVGENANFEQQFLKGELEVEFNPQGTLAERIRAGGAGIPAFFTATGVGTPVAEGKETREYFRPSEDTGGHNRGKAATLTHAHRRPYVLETGLYADLALVKAHTADNFGNLIYRKTARNFNPMMATAAAFVIAEVERVVETGELDGDSIHTPGSYVDRIVRAVPEKRIEQRTVSKG
jgi:3-oxoacid CoA-transferase subunit A